MASSAWPSVVAAVQTLAAASVASPARAVRGRDFSNEPGDVVMVGVTSLDDSPGWDSAGSYSQVFQTFGGARVEEGTVNGVAFSRNGDADQAAATAAVFALIEALGAAIRATPGLGVAGLDYVVAQMETGTVRESQTKDGAVSELSFVVQYQARI